MIECSCVEPDRYTRRPGHSDGGRGTRAGAPQKRDAAVSAEHDHLGIPELPGDAAVTAPLRWVGLGAVSGCPVGVGRGDGVGSARAVAVYQYDALGVTGQDHGQDVLDDGGVVPGPAAGDKEAEGLAHVWLLASVVGCLTR